VEATSSNLPRIGWKATAGSLDKNELITQFQSALLDEIADLKKGQSRGWELYEGKKISDLGGRFIYRFQSGDLSSWRRRRRGTQLNLIIDGKTFYGLIDSWNQKEANIAFETDMGESVEKATVQDSSFELLQNLHDKLEKVKTDGTDFNADGSMKLFGFLEPNTFPTPISFNEQKTLAFSPNVEQQRAIRKSMSQEVTFIWGPPGTGKTKTLGSILNILIGARRSVLLTANTNRAVDEILEKFIEDPENELLIQEGRIVRLGIPDNEDESLNCILFEKVAEKRAATIQKSISELDVQIELLQNTSKKYGEIERSAVERIAQKEHQIREYEKVKHEIVSLQTRMAVVSSSLGNAEVSLSNKRQLLEKAKTTSAIKRFLSGLNREQIESEIAVIENRKEIARLELQSLQKQLDDSVQEKNAISNRINQYRNEIEPGINGLTTLESLRQKILELSGAAESKRKLIIELQTQMERVKESVFNEAIAIGSTIARASLDPKIFKRKFDTLVVDEASMASLPNIFFLAGLCSGHYIISGDFRQLSPIAKCRSKVCQQWLRRDIFNQAGIVESVDAGILDDDRLVMLREQYRMHPAICALVSDAVYERKLKTPEDVSASKEKLAKMPPFEGRALILCDTATTDPLITRPENTFSRLSPYSAAFSSRLAVKCLEEGEKNGLKVKVGIVTPYREQAKLISKMLEDEDIDPTRVVASTIHRFQGSEKDYIIFDLVEGEPLKPGKLTEGTFKNSEAGKLITVAISRAMGKFILVGNSEYIKSKFLPNDAVRQLLDKIIQNGEGIDSCEVERSFHDGYESDENRRPNDPPLNMFDQTDFYDAFVEDLKKSKSRIVIFSPFVSKKRVTDLLPAFKEILEKNVPIYVVTRNPEYCGNYRTEAVESLRDLARIGVTVIPAYKELGIDDKFEKFHYKVAVIDNSVVYYGSLNILSQFDSSESMMAFRSKKTVTQLARVFHISEIIKGKRFGEDLKTDLPVINMVGLEIQKNKCDQQVLTNNQPLDNNTMLNISDSIAISKRFGVVEPGKGVRQRAEDRICRMGKDLGFGSFTWYEVPNLLDDGRNRFISVIWKRGREITVAFQVRRKRQGIDIVTSLKDRRKLDRLQANEKYIVNVSEKTGKAYFHRVTDWDNKNLWITKSTENVVGQKSSSDHEDSKAYSLDEIRLKHARAYESWTEAEDKELISEYHNNLTVSEIAKRHQRQRSAIRSRLRKFGKLGLI
jgi:superfamily I DNA and/or RNA helicase